MPRAETGGEKELMNGAEIAGDVAQQRGRWGGISPMWSWGAESLRRTISLRRQEEEEEGGGWRGLLVDGVQLCEKAHHTVNCCLSP